MSIRRGGFDRYPAAVIGICKEPWNYEWNGGGQLARFDLYAHRVKWNRPQAMMRATKFCYELQQAEKSWVLFLLGARTCSAFGLTRPVWFDWYRSALWGPFIPIPLGMVPSFSEQEMLTAVADGRLPHHGEEAG